MRTAISLASLLLLLLASGCGSITSRWIGEKGNYSGVQYDVQRLTHINNEAEHVVALDIPLSAILDTLLLPFDMTVEQPVGGSPPPNAAE